jgi:hypothetical protein
MPSASWMALGGALAIVGADRLRHGVCREYGTRLSPSSTVPSLSVSKRAAGSVLVAASAGAATPTRAARATVNALRLDSITTILVVGVFRMVVWQMAASKYSARIPKSGQ